ncbi:hypothetical protein Fmac_021441 [Flemingia macrophylla]|uniref:C-JID domain-containing protein n=1 Tax=Flemingia macrophylla TaxID=520843 RepID=A0ABD1LWZ6_9FABA
MKDIANRARWDVFNKQEHEAIEKIVEENLPNLRYLDLSYSESLIEMPYLTGVPRLRDLILQGCIKIMRIHPSIGGNKFARLPTTIKDLSSLYRIVIPGTQIPRWFSKQNVGSSIKMDLSSVMEDPNWMGVACCALLAAHDDPTNLDDKWQLNDHGDIGYSLVNILLPRQLWLLPILLNNDLVTGGIDHLFILFLSRKEIIHYRSLPESKMHDLDKTEFTTKILEHSKYLHLEVKSSGYRMAFKKDLQQFEPKHDVQQGFFVQEAQAFIK